MRVLDKKQIELAWQNDEISNPVIDQAELDEWRTFAVPMVGDLHSYQLSESDNGLATLKTDDRENKHLLLRGLYRTRCKVEIVTIARSYTIAAR